LTYLTGGCRASAGGQQLLEDYGDNMDKIYIQYHGFVPDSNPFRCVYLNPIPLGNIPRVQPRGSSGGGAAAAEMKDLRTIDHWVAKLETNESRNMPPGGYPLAGFEDATLGDLCVCVCVCVCVSVCL